MSPFTSTFLSQIRTLLASRSPRLRRRAHDKQSRQVDSRFEQLEQRQMLVSQMPTQLIVNTSQTPMTVQWSQPVDDPAESFQLTIKRTDLINGGEQTVVYEPAIASAGTAGRTETYTISQALPFGNYSVAVAARDRDATANVTTTAAASTTFSIGEVAPQMLSVSGKQFSSNSPSRPVVGRAVSLTWTVLPGVNEYYVWIGRKNGTAFTQITDAALPQVTGGVCELNLPAGEYQVRVRDLNRTPELWSAPVKFGVTGSQVVAPEISSTPAELQSGAALVWAPLANTVRYQVELTNSGSGALPVTYETSATEYKGSFLAAGNYSARVRGFTAAGRSTSWSLPVAFTIDADSFKPVFMTSPTGTQANGVTVLQWTPVSWAREYEVTVQQISGTTTVIRSRERVQSSRFVFPQLPAGTWRATVRAYDRSDNSGTSQSTTTANFTVNNTTYQPAAPALEYRFEGAQLTWGRIEGAVRYNVLIREIVGGIATNIVQLASQSESFSLDSRFAIGKSYSATVTPILSRGETGVTSSALNFVLVSNPPIAVRLAPNTDSRRPRIEWSENPGAVSYRIRIVNTDTNTVTFDRAGLTRPWFQPDANLSAATYRATVDAVLADDLSATGTSTPFTTTAPPTPPSQSGIRINLVDQQVTVSWNSTAAGMYEIRLVRAEQQDLDVVREQAYFATGSATSKSWAIQSGISSGLYRVDVGRQQSSISSVNWSTGPFFYFDGLSLNPLLASGSAAPQTSPNLSGPFKGDFDGDGDSDVLRRSATSGATNGAIDVYLTTITGFEPSNWNASSGGGFTDFVSNTVQSPIVVGDFNGDGRDDLVQPDMSGSSWSVMRSMPGGRFQKVDLPVSGLINPDLPAIAWNEQTRALSWKPIASPNSSASRDYELSIVSHGDSTKYARIADSVTVSAADNSPSNVLVSLSSLVAGSYTVFMRTKVDSRIPQWSEGFAIRVPSSTAVSGTSPWANPVVGDFNGDRRDDIAMFDLVRQQWSVALSTGTTFERSIWSSLLDVSGSTSLHTVLDVNGDGRKDLVYRNASANSWTVGLSTGTSFLMQTWDAPTFLAGVASDAILRVADMDQDGREDLIAPTSTGFQVAFSRDGFRSTDFNETVWQSAVMPGNTEVADANGDGRPDLIGFDANEKSRVTLTSASGFGAASIWEIDANTPWFVGLEEGGITVADYQSRTNKVQATFDAVNSTIEYEGYRGLKKGADGTSASRSGNAWDQAELLGVRIDTAHLTKVRYVTGRMKLTPAQINAWLTTSVASATYFSRAGLSPSVEAGTGNIEFDHAWLQAWLPTSTGLGWVDLNPSLKASRSAAPDTVSNLFSSDDLKTYLTPVTRSFAASFPEVQVSSGDSMVYSSPQMPSGIQFASGGGILVSNGGWSGTGTPIRPDYKLQTAHASPTTMFVGDTAINGTLSAAITAQGFGSGTLQNYRVFWRSADGSEIGFESFGIDQHGTLSQRIYQRIGDTETVLTSTPEATTTGAPAFSPAVVTMLQQCHVQFSLSGNTVTVFVQWQAVGTNTLQVKKYVTTVIARQGSGRFGIGTGGSGHHFLDDISLTGTDIPMERPLSWTLTQKLNSSNAADLASVDSIGQTRSIIQGNRSIQGSLTPSVTLPSSWSMDDYQTATLSFVDGSGNAVAFASGGGSQLTIPTRLADLVRKQILVRTSADGKSATLLIDGMAYGTTVAQASASNLQLQVVLKTSNTPDSDTQRYLLGANQTSQLLLRAGQYSATDLARTSDQLATAYERIPMTRDSAGAITLTPSDSQAVIDKLLAYSAVRLLTGGEQSEDDIARLTESIIVRPGATSGLITARDYLVQQDSVYFIRPKEMTVDFPVGKLFYAPRSGVNAAQTNVIQQSRARLTLAELSAREQELLAELSDKPALSALQVLSVAGANGAVVRRLKRNIDGTYEDLWSPGTAANADLATFLNFGTSTHQADSFTLVKQQLDGGGIVTIASTMQTFSEWSGFAWLHEKFVTNYQGSTALSIPVIESLMKSNIDGQLLNGGIVNETAAAESSEFSQLRDTGVTPDLNQGILRRMDTDFSISIPGFTVPFTRTWMSERSDASTGKKIIDGTNTSGFGLGWSQPFSQRLDIITMTPETVYTVKKKKWYGSTYTVPVQNNTDRLGEASLINWRRDDGSQGVFSANGQTVVGANGISVSADYDSPVNMPGVIVRRIDGAAAGYFGEFYDVIHADGAVYRFKDFNAISVRQAGQTSALLVSMTDRFGNQVNIVRNSATPAIIEKITRTISGVDITLATFTYTGSVITRVVVHKAPTGDAPAAGVTGDRIWDYTYDNSSRLKSVKVSEATGSGSSIQPISTISRFAYSWYDRVGTDTAPLRADRLEGFLKTAVGLAGSASDDGVLLATTYQYFGNGRLRRVQDAEGRESRFLYNEYAGVSSVIDAAGTMSTTQFNDLGDMVASIQPSGERILYRIAPNVRQVTTTISTNGRSENWQYDAKGNVTWHQDAAGIAQQLTYHPNFNQIVTITEVAPNGDSRLITSNTYYTVSDSGTGKKTGALYSTKDARNYVTKYKYTDQGLISEIISPRGHSTKFGSSGFDAFGNPLQVDYRKNSSGTITTESSSESVFDNTGRLDQVREYGRTGQRDRVTHYMWDALGRLIETLAPNPYDASATAGKVRTQYVYGASGLLDRRIDPDGSVWRTEYDNTGRPLRQYRPDGTFTEVRYNANGTVESSVDANGNSTRFVYDSLNRLVQTIFPDGTSTANVYDAKGDLISEIDARGLITQHEYDASGRLATTIDADGKQTTLGYDDFGNQTTVTTEKGVITNLFNAQHQIIQTLYETKQTVNGATILTKNRVDRFFYDGSGNQYQTESIDLRFDSVLMSTARIASLTDNIVTINEAASVAASRKRVTKTTFDYRDTAESTENAAGVTSSTSLNAARQTISTKDVRGAVTQYAYDLAGGLQYEAMPLANEGDLTGLAHVYRRDLMGRVTETRDVAYSRIGMTTDVSINAATNEPANVTGAAAPRIRKTSYDLMGRVVATQDALGYMTRVTYDPAGNVIESIDASRRSRLSVLDNMGRVVKEVLPPVLVVQPSLALSVDGSWEFPMTKSAYDANGNLVTSTDVSGRTTSFQYDALNRMTMKTSPRVLTDVDGVQENVSPVWQWTYDALGNVTSETDPLLRVTSWTYDLFGRILTKTLPDPDGSDPLAAATTTFRYDAFGNLLSTLEAGNPATTSDDRLTVHEYNSLNLRTKTTLPDPDGPTVTTSNGTTGLQSSPVLTWDYDAAGRMLTEVNALTQVTSYTWNQLGQMTTKELPYVSTANAGPTGPTIVTTYDIFGSPTSTTSTISRTNTGTTTVVVEQRTSFEYDALGRAIRTVSSHPDGTPFTGQRSPSSETTYDASGNVLRVVDHLGRISTSAYDSLNRLIRSTRPDADVTDSELADVNTIQYDFNGNVARSTDAMGRITRTEYDAANRPVLTAVQDTDGWATTETWYDKVGNVTRSIDAAKNATVFTYNAWNKQILVQLPSPADDTADETNDGPRTKTQYDQWGNVWKVTDPRDGVTVYTYDNLNRLTRQLTPTPLSGATRPETVYIYDAAGNVDREQVLVSRSGTTEVWTEKKTFRDALNRVYKVSIRPERVPEDQTPTVETVTTTTYDLAGNVIRVTDAASRTTDYEYDRLNRRVSQTDPAAINGGTRPVTRFKYDSAGNLEATIDPLGRITTSSYDELGRKIATLSPDPDGLQGPLPAPATFFEYDALGNLLVTTDHLGRQTVNEYDIRNRRIRVTRPDADPSDSLAAPTVSYGYDVVGNRTQETDALGNTTDYVYDNLNRLTMTTLPDALANDRLGRPVLSYKYDLSGNLIESTDAAGRVSKYEYDLLNRKYRELTPDPDGVSRGNASLTTVYTFDGLGNVLTTNSYRTSTVGRITTNEYDYLNRLVKITAPSPVSGSAQLITVNEYDAVGNKTISYQRTSTDPGGRGGSIYLYDRLNRLVRQTRQNPTTGLANISVYSTWTYDLAGRLLSSKDEMGRVTTYSYDDLDRRIRIVGPDPDSSSDATPDKIAAETRITYDAAGNIESTSTRRNVDPLNTSASSRDVFLTTFNQYDRLDRLVTSIDANRAATQYRYDNNGNRIALTDASFNTSRWVFDLAGQLIAETDANGFSTVLEYDVAGNVVAVTDRRGYRIQYVRDDLDRIVYEQWLTPITETATADDFAFTTEFRNLYDPYGRQTVAEQWNMTTLTSNTSATLISKKTFSFDDLDRLLSTFAGTTPGQNAARLTYLYDALGNLTSRQQQTGTGASQIIVTTAYSNYDYLNRLTKLKQTMTGTWATWQDKSIELIYRSDDSISSIKRYSDATWTGLVVQSDYGQDSAGRLSSLVHSRRTGTTLTAVASYAYKYFADEKQLSEVWSVPSLNFNNVTETFGYDANGQLTTSAKAAGSESFNYDATGNRTAANGTIGRGNRVTNDGNYAITYDAEGNIIKRQKVIVAQGNTSQEYTTYAWDNLNQLTKVEFFTGANVLTKRVENTYDTDGNRISKKVTTFTTTTTGTTTTTTSSVATENYVYDGQQLIATLNSSGSILHEYFDGPSLDQVFADQSSVSGILWPLEDRTGAARDVLEVVNSVPTVVDHRLMSSFGTIGSRTDWSLKYEQFFSGFLWDADTELYYARARWYEPTSGRFLSEDPIGFEGGDPNVSRYSNNDPINNVDRSGLSWFSHALGEIGDVFEDVGDFFEDQWDNGNIQKGLLAAGTLASGGMLGFGLASGSLLGTEVLAGGLGFASGLGSSYEVFSGNRIGDGSFTRYLGAAAAVSGGFFAAGVRSFGTLGRGLSGASGLISGYEIASGDMIGDGTLSSLFHVSNLGVNHGGTMFSPTSTNAQRFGVGLNLAVGTASVITSGDRSLQQSLRALSIAGGVWNTGTAAIAVASNFRQTIQTFKAAQQPRRAAVLRQARPVEEEPSESKGGFFSVAPEDSVRSAQPMESGEGLLPSVYQLTSPHEVFAYEDTNPLVDFERAEQHLQQKAYRKVEETAANIDKWLAERRRLHVLYVNDDAHQQELTAASNYHDGYVAQFRDLTGQDYQGSLKNWVPPHVPTFGSELGERLFGEESRTNPQSFAYGYRHYLTNPDQMDMDLRVGFYASTTIAATSGTLATGGILFGGGSIGAISTYGGGLVIAGGTAGGIDGGFNAYAGSVNSDGGLAFGIGSGVIGGVLNPISGFTSLGGGVIGGGIDYMSGGDFLSRGYQVGSFAGGIVGMGADDFYKGATFLHAGGQTLVNGTIMGGTAYAAYQYSGNMDTALFAGNLAAVPGSIFARWAVTCFPAGTPVLTPNGSVPIEELCIGDLVLSRDQHNLAGQVAAKAVDQVYVREGELWELTIAGHSLQITADHPVYVEDKGWIPAGTLVRGNRVAMLRQLVHATVERFLDDFGLSALSDCDWDSDWGEVESCHSTGKRTTVYNLRVTDWHTYFVSLGDECCVWAHNAQYDFASYNVSPSVLNRTHSISGRTSSRKVVDIIDDMYTRQAQYLDEWNGTPITVVEHAGQLFVRDGHHRLYASKLVGLETVPIQVVPFEPRPGSWQSMPEFLFDAATVGSDKIRIPR